MSHRALISLCEEDVPRGRPRTSNPAALTALVVALILGVVTFFLVPSTAVDDLYRVLGAKQTGCLTYDDVVAMKPGELRTIEVKVNYGHCKPLILAALSAKESTDSDSFLQLMDPKDRARYLLQKRVQEKAEMAVTFTPDGQQTYGWDTGSGRYLDSAESYSPSASDVVVGLETKVQLSCPQFPVQISPISEVAQTIVKPDDVGTWSWQIRPDKPGKCDLSLVVIATDAQDSKLVYRTEAGPIHLTVGGTLGYYLGRFGGRSRSARCGPPCRTSIECFGMYSESAWHWMHRYSILS